MKSFERTGIWWLPEAPEDKLYGKLTFHPKNWGKLELRMEGYGHESFNKKISPYRPFSIILGIMDDVPVTLNYCTLDLYNIPLLAKERVFWIDTIFVGHHFQEIDEIMFKELSLSYTYLDEWMGQYNLEIKEPRENYSYDITYTPFEPVQIPLEDIDVEFGYDYLFPPMYQYLAGISLRDTACITIRPKPCERFHFNNYRQYINFHFPAFLTLATGDYNYPLNIRGIATEGESREISIFYPVPGYVEKEGYKTRMEMLFTFDNVKTEGNLKKHLSNWMSKSEKLRAAIDLYYRFSYQKNLDVRTQFLFLVQALETYQRTLYGGEYLSKSAYKSLVRDLKNAIPLHIEDDLRENLKARIDNGNKYSLRRRLIHICDEILGDHIGIVRGLCCSTSEEFATKVTATRNDLTHYPKNRSRKAIPRDELHIYVGKMQFLLRICFLVEMEFSSDEIKQLLVDNFEYKSLMRQMSLLSVKKSLSAGKSD